MLFIFRRDFQASFAFLLKELKLEVYGAAHYVVNDNAFYFSLHVRDTETGRHLTIPGNTGMAFYSGAWRFGTWVNQRIEPIDTKWAVALKEHIVKHWTHGSTGTDANYSGNYTLVELTDLLQIKPNSLLLSSPDPDKLGTVYLVNLVDRDCFHATPFADKDGTPIPDGTPKKYHAEELGKLNFYVMNRVQ